MKNKTSQDIIKALDEKYSAEGQDKNVYLEGLLHSKPMNYWDYIHTDALLNLQIQRTNFPDEMVFIGYHQINELIFKICKNILRWHYTVSEKVSCHPIF